MDLLKTLETLIIEEKAALHETEMNALSPSVVGATIGSLYAVILGNKQAMADLETIVNRKRQEAIDRNK